jgi:hypothetical protein
MQNTSRCSSFPSVFRQIRRALRYEWRTQERFDIPSIILKSDDVVKDSRMFGNQTAMKVD